MCTCQPGILDAGTVLLLFKNMGTRKKIAVQHHKYKKCTVCCWLCDKTWVKCSEVI